jgi:hypothetical protein
MPVRKIPVSHRSVTGLFPSRTNKRMVHYESTLERDFFFLCEFDLDVRSYDGQPVRIEYQDEMGKDRHYTPDVLVTYRSDVVPALWMTPLLAEIKYRKDLKDDQINLRRRIRAGRAYARAHGWRFRVLTETEIRTPYLDNARFLMRYRKLEPDFSHNKLLLDAMHELREADPATLLAFVFYDDEMKGMLLPSLWQLIAEQSIWCDLRLPLSMTSRIWEVDGHLPDFHPTVYPPYRAPGKR